jgi:hypothetical protein
MRAFKITVSTVVAFTVGFVVGWVIQFGRLMAEHRPDGCDGPCLVLAGEFYDEALWGGLIGALALGLPILALAWRYFANPPTR